ncbi:MAG: universal stress protein [Nitrospirae bacterium]|nr:universal stress protein [Nitrospirota bacterium]
MKILTIYDGTIQSKTALRYGIRKAKEKGGEVLVLHVFQSSLFIDYGAGPKAEEAARAEVKRHLQDAENMIREVGPDVSVKIMSVEGDPAEETLRVAEAEHAGLILASPRYRAILKKASCPVYIMPGTILVPLGSSDMSLANKEDIIAETKATSSKVLLLGIVPVHLYSAGEKVELEQVKKWTTATVKKIKSALTKEGIDVSEAIKSGYPDEEILKAAEEYSVSLIMLPAGGKTPSELTKAASILLDEPERARMPILLMREAGV